MTDNTKREILNNPSAGFSSKHDFTTAKIMLVDDEPITLEMVKAYLEDFGYSNFILVEKSVEAMDLIKDGEPDILLLDLMMPEVSGFDILEQVRRHPKLRYLPIIVLTASTDQENKLRALDLGATDFLAKPVDPSELSLRVRNTLAAKAYLDELAYYDSLTSLPNRKMFLELFDNTLNQAERFDENIALLNIELDHLDQISDTMGIRAGDEVLRQIKSRIEKVIRNVDLLGPSMNKDDTVIDLFKMEGAVFSLILYRLNDAGNAALVSARILEEVRKPVQLDEKEFYITASIGITTYPSEGKNSEDLIRLASSAKDFAKQKGGDTFQFSSVAISESYEKRHSLESGLRKALDQNELVLFYQPKVKVSSNTIEGFEALIRWNSANGFIPPGDFIPLAEETGIIVEFGKWILKEACTRLHQWHREGQDRLSMAINVSAKQLVSADFFSTVEGVVSQSGVNPKLIKLEMTESLLLDDIDSKILLLKKLRGMGLRISVDDFGTGYSSLSYLSRLPVDELKIDKSFIDDIAGSSDSRAIVSTIIYLARNLGLQTVAEGIETQEQLNFLQQAGCDIYQGYLFSKPLPADELQRLL